jgi:hypothetical protein
VWDSIGKELKEKRLASLEYDPAICILKMKREKKIFPGLTKT